ncbi:MULTISPECIES: J domain-containing protein [Streptomyces]|uniref:J domain-containing protein n=1 Tax=Streptomyces fimbriatus TaxID=68197 RepID=A0ABW0CZY3_STRFI
MSGQRPRRDHYAVLGVQSDASPQQITTAFRVLVRSLHPDTRRAGTPAAPEDLAEAVAAYETLRDPRRRAAYDAGRDRRGGGTGSGRPIPVRVTRTTGRAPTRRASAGPVGRPADADVFDALARLLPPRPSRTGPVSGPRRAEVFDPVDPILRWIRRMGPWL